jgi:hypothetical protein
MARRLDWEKARRQELEQPRRRNRHASKVRAKARAQGARHEFVQKHGVGCFKCGTQAAEWAKTGISKRGPWAICVPCVKGGSSKTSG